MRRFLWWAVRFVRSPAWFWLRWARGLRPLRCRWPQLLGPRPIQGLFWSRPAGEGYHGGYARAGDYSGSYGVESHKSELSQQSTIRNLPWSTANEDFVELFETPRTGQVDLAEILFDGTRSKGAGVVQFAQVAEAETAIGTDVAKFQLYV